MPPTTTPPDASGQFVATCFDDAVAKTFDIHRTARHEMNDRLLQLRTAGKTPDAAIGFIDRLAPAVAAKQHQEYADIQAMIDKDQKANGQPSFKLQPWDWAYYAERVRRERFDVEAGFPVAGPVEAVGHRVVHGGMEFSEPVRIDAAELRRLQTGLVIPPAGQPPEWFEAIRAGVLGNRSEFYRFVPENPFYGYNLDREKPSEAIIANWWRQGMAGGALAHYATVDSWLEDYTEDLKKITVPVLVMHGEADQVVPFASSVPRAVDLLKNGSLKTYPGYPHGMLTTYADVLNPDLLSFIRS